MKPTLVILAAGMGTRYGGLKQIDPVGPAGEAILDYSMYDALHAGFERVVFVIRRDIETAFRETVGRRFEQRVDVGYVFQELDRVPGDFVVPATRQKPWGTAHAVLAAADAVQTPFAVINADDFYGAESYATLARFLGQAGDDAKAHYALVGFKLRNTLSDHGHVARGICACDNDLYLQVVTERTRILKRGEAAVFLDETEQEHPLTGDEWVSMNMWGFTPSYFVHAERLFGEFLQSHGQEEKSELYIPSVVDALIGETLADVKVLPTASPWFGVTYREDKPSVVESIQKLVQAGRYPNPLWG